MFCEEKNIKCEYVYQKQAEDTIINGSFTNFHSPRLEDFVAYTSHFLIVALSKKWFLNTPASNGKKSEKIQFSDIQNEDQDILLSQRYYLFRNLTGHFHYFWVNFTKFQLIYTAFLENLIIQLISWEPNCGLFMPPD